MKKTQNYSENRLGAIKIVLIDEEKKQNNDFLFLSSVSVILDFENFSVKHLYRPVFRVLSQISDTVDANYPETLGR